MSAPVRLPMTYGPGLTTRESRPGSQLGGLDGSEGAANADGVQKPFLSYLESELKGANNLQQEADASVAAMATGQSNNLHETMIALDKADVSFRMLTRVRNKVIDAYQEIMRMNI